MSIVEIRLKSRHIILGSHCLPGGVSLIFCVFEPMMIPCFSEVLSC